jgi:hypothetical protein
VTGPLTLPLAMPCVLRELREGSAREVRGNCEGVRGECEESARGPESRENLPSERPGARFLLDAAVAGKLRSSESSLPSSTFLFSSPFLAKSPSDNTPQTL